MLKKTSLSNSSFEKKKDFMDCERYWIDTCNDRNTFLSAERGWQQSNPHPTSPSPSRVSHPLPGCTTTKG